MSWFEYSANQTEAAKSRCGAFLAVDFDFSMGHQRYWTGCGLLSIFGNSYIGAGELASISSPAETVRPVAEKKNYRLSMAALGISILSEADIEASYSRSVTEYLGFFDLDSLQIIANPEINWEGTIGSIRRVAGPDALVEISTESILAIGGKADGWRYTHEHQQQFFSGDTGFKEVPSIEQRQLMWGGYFVYPGTTRASRPPGHYESPRGRGGRRQ